jgi:hypothetical protein
MREFGPSPATPDDAELLLRRVPELAGLPEFAGCVREPVRTAGWPPTRAELAAHADPALAERVRRALGDLHARADREGAGGLGFLAGALAHFLAPARALPPLEHPLIVALLLRAAAQARGEPDGAAAIAALMDLWT